MLFVLKKIIILPQKAMWQHVVSPCWSPVHKSLEISDVFARLFLVIQRRNHTLTARHEKF